MKILYIDGAAGISGDMTLGAFLDLGVPFSYLQEQLSLLHVPGFRLEKEKGSRRGISGTICHVYTEEQHAHRHLAQIRQLIGDSALEEKVKRTASDIFQCVAEAEAAVHGVDIEEVHFHEVGALDSIADIVGAAACFHYIAPDAVYATAVNTGSGYIQCAHGLMSVPAPAVAEILSHTEIRTYAREIETEAVTPTGAAILSTLASYHEGMPPMRIERVGYGLGSKDFPIPNALRIFLGTSADEAIPEKGTDELSAGTNAAELSAGTNADETAGTDPDICVLEANLDDMTGEAMGYAMEKLLKAGALDVYYTPIYMKKCRPANMLTVLAPEQDRARMEELILHETTTLGVRSHTARRCCMQRTTRRIDTPWGELRIKESILGSTIRQKAEYEDIRRIADAQKLSFAEAEKLAADYLTQQSR